MWVHLVIDAMPAIIRLARWMLIPNVHGSGPICSLCSLRGCLFLFSRGDLFYLTRWTPIIPLQNRYLFLMLHEADAYLLHSLRRILTLYIPQDGCLSLLFRDMNAYLYAPKVDAYLFYLQRGCLLCLFLVFLEAGAYLLLFAKQTLISYAIRHIFIYYTPRDGSSLHFARRIFISFARWVPSILHKAANVCPSLRVPCRASLPSWRSGSCILYIYL